MILLDSNSSNFEKARELFLKSLDFQKNGDFIEAKNRLESAFKLYPNRESIINNLLIIYFRLKDADSLNKILPKINHYDYQYNIGRLYHYYLNKKYILCIDESHQLLENLQKKQQPTDQILDLITLCYYQVGDINNLLSCCKKILKNKGQYEQKLFSVGNIFFLLSKPRAAKWFIEKSLKIESNKAYLNHLGYCFLQLKNFKDGFSLWKSKFDLFYHFKMFQNIALIKTTDDLQNKKIVVWYEQGIGDTLLFSRYVKNLKKFTSNITFVVQDSLIEIFENFDDIIIISNYENSKSKFFHYQISLQSLLSIIDISYNEIHYEPLKFNIGHKSLKNNHFIKNVGFAYSGNPEYLRDMYRSMKFSEFSPLFSIKNIEFFKLNKKEEHNLDQFKNVTDLGHLSLINVAKKLFELDIIITTDTFLVHLCGVLNIKCILLLNYNSDWRWFEDKRFTKWYPSVRIIKQKKLLRWEKIIKTMIRFLKKKSNILV